jgi:hypothetical protein
MRRETPPERGFRLIGAPGLEPGTSSPPDWRANQAAPRPVLWRVYRLPREASGRRSIPPRPPTRGQASLLGPQAILQSTSRMRAAIHLTLTPVVFMFGWAFLSGAAGAPWPVRFGGIAGGARRRACVRWKNRDR